jgi:hypothetical protein
MKQIWKFFALAIVMIAFSAGSFAQVTANATATATIVTPIAIANAGNMNFGNVAVSAVAGTVILDPAGTRTTTAGVTLPIVPGTVAAAHFAVTGTPAYTYVITLPSTATTVTSGGNTMTVTGFTSFPSGTGTLDAAGAQTINVGATLNVGAGQPSGTYVSGTPFDVTVNYN